jgi:DNA-binding NarL/FixJ family response regulator
MGGIEAMTGIRDEFPDARIVVLTTYTGDVQTLRALRAGARGYMLKGHVHTDLLDTIRAVHAGKKRVPPEVAAELAGRNANKEIGARLAIVEETVKSHVTKILSKLAANDRTHAVTIGLKRGIIDL